MSLAVQADGLARIGDPLTISIDEVLSALFGYGSLRQLVNGRYWPVGFERLAEFAGLSPYELVLKLTPADEILKIRPELAGQDTTIQ
jgi:hypothetical protein